MTIDEYVDTIIEQIEVAKDDKEVEKIIQLAVAKMEERKKNGFIIQRCMDKLGFAIQDLYALECSYRQWNCYRFALTIIGKLSVKNIIKD
ncbi:hypothetical protein F0L74_27630 [Chitinophaga agrisoli]|uniref:Uncharacterized protein n=1 Tax=Chitinophaga agrisoli TaxID=2607653 RepID=A0A5B2VNH9_9BACT|nr:hypothetical protein [Chitinophaga agrisoli]KAA2239956.1 hypothetical protein F0L74_27630 [Chitinophaga agrisoli]